MMFAHLFPYESCSLLLEAAWIFSLFAHTLTMSALNVDTFLQSSDAFVDAESQFGISRLHRTRRSAVVASFAAARKAIDTFAALDWCRTSHYDDSSTLEKKGDSPFFFFKKLILKTKKKIFLNFRRPHDFEKCPDSDISKKVDYRVF